MEIRFLNLSTINFCCGGCAYVAISLHTMHQIPEASLPHLRQSKHVSKHCQMSSVRQNCPQLKAISLNLACPMCSNASKFGNLFLSISSEYLSTSRLQLLNHSREHLETMTESMSWQGPQKKQKNYNNNSSNNKINSKVQTF